jgi:hypothetical protein
MCGGVAGVAYFCPNFIVVSVIAETVGCVWVCVCVCGGGRQCGRQCDKAVLLVNLWCCRGVAEVLQSIAETDGVAIIGIPFEYYIGVSDAGGAVYQVGGWLGVLKLRLTPPPPTPHT